MIRKGRGKEDQPKQFPPTVVLFVFCLLAGFIYSNVFFSPFLFDDTSNIEGNPQIRSLANFLNPAGTRYVGFLSFALNYAAGGLNVFGYHLVNVLIHVANGFLVYVLILLLLRLPAGSLEGSSINHRPSTIDHQRSFSPIALLAALLFLVHPVQTQAVTYIVQRFASLVTLFYLLAVVCYLKWRLSQTIGPGGPIRLIYFFASLLSTLLAMKTKENSFTLPLMILLVELIFFRGIRGASKAPSSGPPKAESLPLNGPSGLVQWLALVPFLLTLLIVPLSYHEPSMEERGAGPPLDIPPLGRLEYFFTQCRVIVTYLRLLVFPVHQSLDYDYPVYHSFFQPAVLVSFVFLLGLVAWAVRHIGRTGPIRLIVFGIFWFFLTVSFESSIFPIKDVINEHRVYLPSVGFFLVAGFLTASAWGRWKKIRVPIILLILMVIGGFSVAAHRRNGVWRDPVTLWEDVVQKAPRKARGRQNLGIAYRDQGRVDEAIAEYQTALRLHPEYPAMIYDNLGVAYKMKGAVSEAMRAYQTALRLNPNDAGVHSNLGVAYQDEGRMEEAIAEYRTALRLKPDFVEVHYNLGSAYFNRGMFQEARAEFEEALKIRPDFEKAREALDSLDKGVQ
ncbi:MAG: tetratricopeptide repeat protein [Deltaproteobacteria bacterium]|nr:tetratricopeptide repeat protein [Deltaproteobacteria bacterium]